ncbi:MAG: hypothetical protein EBS84_18240 [Proteobacteria bacterium]|nr:hypothetical protein [Verrucomicrobiota bacterium]NBU10931.1 hypothetical protein [Pseudomonadota bacterium]
MQRFPIYATLLLAAAWLAGAADYKLKDGTTLSGEGISFTDKGVVIKNADNKVLPRTAWTNFSQEGLKEFAKNPKARPFVELLVEDAPAPDGTAPEINVPDAAAVPARPPAKWKEVEGKPTLPENPGLIGGMFTTGIGWLSLIVVYAAIIYAGYEVAIYRRRPRNMVMGLSAIPFVGIAAPITFLILPPVKSEEEAKPTAVQQALAKAKEEPKPEEKPAPGKKKPGLSFGKKAEDAGHDAPAAAGPKPVAVAKPGNPAPAAPAKAPAAAAPTLEPAVYRRGETNINKRFIETKFAGFFKAVLGPAEKDMWVVWVTATGGEHWSKRIVSITQTDVVVNCPQEGGGTLDETIQIAAIQEIHLRPQEG